jgi:cell division transport system permease protein
VKAWIHAHLEALRLALRRLTAQPAGMLLSTAVMVAALFLPLAGYVAATNLAALGERVGSQARITVFLAGGAREPARAGVEQLIRGDPSVRRAEFVGRDQALSELSRRLGGGELLSGLDANPLPDAFVITVAESADASAFAERLRRLPGVESVDDDPSWASKWRALSRLANSTVLVAGLLAVLAMVAICYNTIGLQVLTHAEEAAVMRLFGATPGQIRRPFVYFGGLQGLISGGLAVGLLQAAVIAIEPSLGQLIQQYGIPAPTGLSAHDAVTVVAFSATWGAAGAWLACRRY